MAARWYKRCGADFIHGTMMLSLEEKGAYSLCLDLIYDRGGPIPDDARWLSGVCGVSMRRWNSIRDRLLTLGKLAAEGGHLTNERAVFELASAEACARERAESGSKGGRKRAENRAQPHKSNTMGEAELKREEERREEGESPPKPPRRRAGGKHLLPEDWTVPPVAELPPQARACAETWSPESYAARGEEFVSFWRSRGRMMSDWRLTWAGRVVDIHALVMRDQKFGNAPTAKPAARAFDAGWTEADRDEHRAINALKARLDSAYDSALWNEWFSRKSKFYERVGRAAPREWATGPPRQAARAAEAALARARTGNGSASGGEYG